MPDRILSIPTPDAPDRTDPGLEAIARHLDHLFVEGRRRLYEHEVYGFLRLVSGLAPPRHLFIAAGSMPDPEALASLGADRIVLKIVSPDIAHKTEIGGVVICRNDAGTVHAEIDRMRTACAPLGRLTGVLAVECVERDHAGVGGELFVGFRATREFGPVLAAGLGGTQAEFLAGALRPDRSVARAPAMDLSAEGFLELFRGTAAYELVSGRVRGGRRLVEDDALRAVFAAFIAIARRFGIDRGGAPGLVEFEVNPFAARTGALVPLDGRARLDVLPPTPAPRPRARIDGLLEPGTIAVLGVSATQEKSFGRIILRNVLESGFDPERVRVVKPGAGAIDGVARVACIRELPWTADLLVVAAGAGELPGIIDECVESGRVGSAILIPGGAGETESSADLGRRIRAAIAQARRIEDGPVFLGPNCLGVQSRPGRYDTLFIPAGKLDPRRDRPHRGVALVSQSGAFIVSRMSRVESLDPAFTVSIGNQADLTLSDLVRAIGERADIHTLGVYSEGFADLDALAFVRAVRALTDAGRRVVFYKAGRTAAGRDAAAGHTASLAGDHEVCEAAARQAGALIAEDFEDFTALVEVCAAIGARGPIAGGIGAIANAGCETVAMGDRAGEAVLPALASDTVEGLRAVLAAHGLGALVNPRNPLDLTPMAGAGAYEDASRVMLRDSAVGALIVSCIPLTPAIASTADEIGSGCAFAAALGRLRDEGGKAIIAVVDAGARYEAFVEAVRRAGVPVLRSADRAASVLSRVLAG